MPEPGWTFTADTSLYAETTLDFLRADPIGNTVVLGITSRLHNSPYEPQPDDCYGWWTDGDGRIGAAFTVQVPYALALSADMPEPAARTLAEAWTAEGRDRPSGIMGQVRTAEAIAADWAARTAAGYRVKPQHSMRLFEFAEPTPPDPAPRGAHRLATLADVPLLTRWDTAFLEECGIPLSPNQEASTRARIEDGRTVLWTVGDGESIGGIESAKTGDAAESVDTETATIVAMASYTAIAAESSRITAVYTPSEHRKHGYAAGVTWATTHLARAAGARHVLLHTDLSNPTSNGVYQRLGYRAVHDVAEYEFTD